MNTYHIYSDGSCYPNPGGSGGWGAVIIQKDNGSKIIERRGFSTSTTNNRMEIKGFLIPIESIKKKSSITVYSDSEYAVKSANWWSYKWVKNNEEDRPNIDLWKRVHKQKMKHKIKWVWVKGHDGNMYNERADEIASEARLGVGRKKTVYIVKRDVVLPDNDKIEEKIYNIQKKEIGDRIRLWQQK